MIDSEVARLLREAEEQAVSLPPRANRVCPVTVARMPATISVRDLRKSYGKVTAVDGVTFEVERGEFFGILGPNGAGKTTALEIIEGLREPDGGEVTVLGRQPCHRRRSGPG